jgi:hypothetical protein
MPMHPFTFPTTLMHPRLGTTLSLLTELMYETAKQYSRQLACCPICETPVSNRSIDAFQESAKRPFPHCAS